MKTKQTAVQWLLNAIETKNGKEFSSYYSEFIEQAKEMEKEQIINSRENGLLWGVRSTNNFYYDKIIESKDYYDKTYGGKNV